MAGGFVFGLLAGHARTYAFGPSDLPLSARWILALQIAVAFAALALFVVNYLELRKRVIRKASAYRDTDSKK